MHMQLLGRLNKMLKGFKTTEGQKGNVPLLPLGIKHCKTKAALPDTCTFYLYFVQASKGQNRKYNVTGSCWI